MPLPVIKHRESFGWPGYYNASSDFVGFDQLYMQTRWEEGVSNAALALRGWLQNAFFFGAKITQSGRGTPVQGYAFGGRHMLGMMLARFGISNATTTPRFGIAFAYNQGGHVGDSLIAEFGTEDGVYRHLSIETNGIGRVIARNGATGDVIGVSDGTVANSGSGTVPYFMPIGAKSDAPPMTHLEIKPTFHSTAGTVQVKADEQLILNLTNRNTVNIGPGGINEDLSCGFVQLLVGMPALNPFQEGQTLADVILHDASGDGWFGDKSVFWLSADQVGHYTAGTAVGAGSKLLAVQDRGTGLDEDGIINYGSDADASYTALDDTGLPKAFSAIVEAFPADAKQIIEVAPLSLMRKDDGGTSLARVGMRVVTTEVDNGSDIAVPTGYTPYQFGRTTNPATGAAWAVSDIIDVFHRRAG